MDKASVNIRMITNNSLDTAKEVAVKSNLLNDKQLSGNREYKKRQYALHAADFNQKVGGLKQDEKGGLALVNQEYFDQAFETVQVIARADPNDKVTVTAGLKKNGRTIAVVGDSNYDVKAFKVSQVSFCMNSGTTLAKENASIILLNDDFKGCLNAVMWGRNIYANCKRFIEFQVIGSWSLMLTIFIGYFVLYEAALNNLQLLYINLIIDTFAALAYSTQFPQRSAFSEPPISKTQSILSPVVWRQIIGLTLWQVGVMCFIIFYGKQAFSLEYGETDLVTDTNQDDLIKNRHLTMIFNTFIFLQWFNFLNCRVVGPRQFNLFAEIGASATNLVLVVILVVVFTVQYWTCCMVTYPFDTTLLN